MKSLMKIYIKYIATALILILLFLVIQFVVLGVAAAKIYGNGSNYGKYSIIQVYDVIVAADGRVEASQPEAAAALIQIKASFAMLLNQSGVPEWTWQLPENLNHDYTVSEVASFTRWYLDDYPVSVWGGDKGLLVIGYPRGSVWNYNVRQDVKEFEGFFTFLSLSFLCTIAAAVLILLLSGYRYYRKMRVMADGIGRLASGGSVSLPESGTMKDLASALNRTSDRLTRQREQLERRDEARTEWISGVSHDIRTPLSLVMGYADMIENQPGLEPEVRNRAALIRRQSLRIRDLIEDLNLASKLEYNMQPLRLQSVSLAAILRKVAADLLNTMERPQDYPFSIEITPEFEEYSMEGDEQLLFRAFRNILGNSVRHNENGCSIDLSASVESGGPVISFVDSGIGIPEAVCRYLNEDVKPEGEIHIMGLRIVKQIIKAHGGEIRAEMDGKKVTVKFGNFSKTPPAGRKTIMPDTTKCL